MAIKKITVKQLKQIVSESVTRALQNVSTDDVLGSTEPKFDVSPEEVLIHKIYAASNLKSKFAGLEPEEIAAKLGLGGDSKIIELIDSMMNSPMYQKN